MFRFALLILLGFSFSLLSFSQSAWAEQISEQRRVALVIGNSAYKHTSPLDNPKNDATVMAKVLGELGF